ncbi:unnamed protein product [Trichobilharzia szidati]|nr:unnamed protein product [Trichobilharzia szidati]CAH8862070.1 unnamed protein product [Trichobilharzia szidati]
MFRSITKSLLKTLKSMPYREINSSADDINQIVLLGRVNSIHLTENADKAYVSIGLTTKNTYKTSSGYSSSYAYHNVYVFTSSLIDKVRHLIKGDRLCITGYLTSYKGGDGQWRFCVTANTVSPYTVIQSREHDAVMTIEKDDIEDEGVDDKMPPAYEVQINNNNIYPEDIDKK